MTIILRPTLEETRDLVRTALSEAFPGITLSTLSPESRVRGSTNIGRAGMSCHSNNSISRRSGS